MALIDTGIGAAVTLARDLIDRIFPDKDKQAAERAQYLLKAQEIDNELAKGQIAINQQEAQHENLFVSGWRPFIGWVCGSAFAYHFIIQPLLVFMMAATGHNFTLPVFDTNALYTVLMGLLGLGSMRTYEKVQTIKTKGG